MPGKRNNQTAGDVFTFTLPAREVIRNIRSWSNLLIIVISVRSEDNDKIEALDAGADDFLIKSFFVEELHLIPLDISCCPCFPKMLERY